MKKLHIILATLILLTCQACKNEEKAKNSTEKPMGKYTVAYKVINAGWTIKQTNSITFSGETLSFQEYTSGKTFYLANIQIVCREN